MKRFIFGSLVICLLALSGGFLVMTRMNAHAANQPGVKPAAAPVSISSQRLKELVRQTLGQQAVDHMGQRVTQPLAISSSTQMPLPNQSKMATASRSRSSVWENYLNSYYMGGYVVDAEGVSQVQGVGGFFNAPTVQGTQRVTTEIGLENADASQKITLGVMKNGASYDAYLLFQGGVIWTLFPVSANDQMDGEIYLDGNTNSWLLFIEDMTTGKSFGSEFVYTTNNILAWWGTTISNGGPVPSMSPITFTNANWFSDWAGWQPIISSAEAVYEQWTLVADNEGVLSPTEVNPPATSFSLISCPTCRS